MNQLTPVTPLLPCNARIAAIQMVSGTSVGDNLQTARTLIADAAAKGAKLVLLPEYFALMGGSPAEKARATEAAGSDDYAAHKQPGSIQHFLSETAREHKIWLIGGSISIHAPIHAPSQSARKHFNTCLVFNPDGEPVARYDKIHLFSFQNGAEHYDEGASIQAGIIPRAFDCPFGRIGLSICYDLRFPELYRALGKVDLIVVPAAFTETTGRAHWEILLRARAIENQCYLLAAAQGGCHANGRETHGNSLLIDPWGTIIARREKGAGMIIGEIDHQKIQETRNALPALKHRVL